jgi:uncharacterized damage-inducible protein DinB
MTLPRSTDSVPDRGHLYAAYLDYFRERIIGKVAGLPPEARRTSHVPSGWTPLALLKHLRYVELRWIEWGFQGRDVGEPWADSRGDVWYAAAEEEFDDLVAALREQGDHTRAVVTATDLEAVGVPGDRWDGADPASLDRVMLHLIQEYAHHAGHIDIVAELVTPAK